MFLFAPIAVKICLLSYGMLRFRNLSPLFAYRPNPVIKTALYDVTIAQLYANLDRSAAKPYFSKGRPACLVTLDCEHLYLNRPLQRFAPIKDKSTRSKNF